MGSSSVSKKLKNGGNYHEKCAVSCLEILAGACFLLSQSFDRRTELEVQGFIQWNLNLHWKYFNYSFLSFISSLYYRPLLGGKRHFYFLILKSVRTQISMASVFPAVFSKSFVTGVSAVAFLQLKKSHHQVCYIPGSSVVTLLSLGLILIEKLRFSFLTFKVLFTGFAWIVLSYLAGLILFFYFLAKWLENGLKIYTFYCSVGKMTRCFFHHPWTWRD